MSYYGDLENRYNDTFNWCKQYTDQALTEMMLMNLDLGGHSKVFVQAYLDRYKPQPTPNYQRLNDLDGW